MFRMTNAVLPPCQLCQVNGNRYITGSSTLFPVFKAYFPVGSAGALPVARLMIPDTPADPRVAVDNSTVPLDEEEDAPL
jgi:hypothetical protein